MYDLISHMNLSHTRTEFIWVIAKNFPHLITYITFYHSLQIHVCSDTDI